MIKNILLSLPLLMLIACGAKEPAKTPDNNAPANNEADNGGNGHGKSYPLLKVKLKEFGRIVKVTQLGEMEAGKEGAIEIGFNTSKDRISTVRAWVGIESGIGSTKAKMEIEGDTLLHGHIEVPKPIPAGSKLYVTFEADGKTETISMTYK